MPELDSLLVSMVFGGSGKNQDHQYDFETLKTALQMAGEKGASSAAKLVLGTLGPLTMAVEAWIGAARVASRMSSNMTFWDMMPRDKLGNALYQCTCQKCDTTLEFIIGRQEGKVSRIAISITVVGAIPVAVYALQQALKGEVTAARRRAAQELQQAALPFGRKRKVKTSTGALVDEIQVLKKGCRKAQAIIATLMGEHSNDPKEYKKTPAAIVAIDGWVAIKQKID
jgi:hypothetical protein